MSSTRPPSIAVGSCALSLPIFFPSVSSLKTNARPDYYVAMLAEASSRMRQFLVSAYDLERGATDAREALAKELRDARACGQQVLLDSGNYEGYWRDAAGAWTETEFHRVLASGEFDLAFGFDAHDRRRTGRDYVGDVLTQHTRDSSAAGAAPVVPIVHGLASELPDLCVEIASATGITMLALPERELGNGILERLGSVRAIRSALATTGRYVALHLLGTGNPISIALFVWAGADSFDGLEWCQTVVDFDSAALSHLSHFAFFKAQTNWADSGWPDEVAVLGHNLEFMSGWLDGLRAAPTSEGVASFCELQLPPRVLRACRPLLANS